MSDRRCRITIGSVGRTGRFSLQIDLHPAIFTDMSDLSSQDQTENFKTTRWTLVSEAGDPQNPLHDEALAHLLTLYRPALLSHLVNRRRLQPQHADDLLQDFILRKVLQYNLIQHADRKRGKFRTLLLTSLDNFVRGSMAKSDCLGEFPEGFEPADQHPGADQAFDVPWARQVLQESLRRMKAECRHANRMEIWDIFDSRILGPTLEGSCALSYDQLVARHHLQSPAQASNLLMTSKRMFERNLRAVVGEYAHEGQIDTEIAELREILSHAAA
jgi:DNA-directed RNA polymerase specialized sigma24 family protein